jgi:Phage tail lysozyme
MPDPAASTDSNIPSMVVTPDPPAQTADDKPSDKQGKGPVKLTYDDMVKRWTDRGYPKAAAQGIADNMMRESRGNSSAVGDDGTSLGLFQEHNSRKSDLESYAKKLGKSATDPDVQIAFADQELKDKFPTLRKQLLSGDDRGEAEDSFKRVFERPASIMWQNSPRLSSDRYAFSDYALNEHNDRPNTSVLLMQPQDYLDLARELDGNPFETPSGRALLRSVSNGDDIESIPSLEMRVQGNTGTVTDQDGRHRALLAQQEGVDAIPVAVHSTGQGQPTEIQGMTGNILPLGSFQAARQVPKSLWSRVAGAIVPSAEAAEPHNVGWGQDDEVVQAAPQGTQPAQDAPADADWGQGDEVVQPAAGQPDGPVVSALKGAGAGFGRTVLAGQELAGKGLDAVGATGAGDWLVNDARKGLNRIDQEIAPDQAAHPWATGAGDLAGSAALPTGIAGRVAGNALRAAAISGGVSGLLSPSSGDGSDYWTSKALQAAGGAATGAAVGKAGNMLANAVVPSLNGAAGKLVREGVQLTPGQLAGGAMKRAEDALASVPFLGSLVRNAQQKSLETFNQAAVNRSLADIGAKLPPDLKGHDAISWAEDEFGKAYNSVIPSMKGIRDPKFVSDLNDVVLDAQAKKLPPEYQDQLKHIIQTEILDRFDANGHITGDQTQKIGTQLDSLIKPMQRSDNPYTQQLARHVRDADRVLDDMMAAHNPALQAAKDRIDAGWAKFKTVQAASRAAGAAPDGTFTPAQLSRSVLARDRSKDKAAFARGDAMMQDLARAAREVLPQKVPDSGTAERAALIAGITGAAKFEPHTAAVLGAAALPYTAPASRMTNALVNRLAQAPGPTRNALAQILRQASTVAAPAAGSMAARNIPSMVVYPDQEQ